MIELALVLLLIPLGRWAGGAWPYSRAASPLTGLVLGLLCGVTDRWLLAFMLAAWLGEKPGTGHPLGHLMGEHDSPCTEELEWYEWEGVRDRPYVGLAVRGVVSAAPYLPIVAFHPTTSLLFLYAITWPLSAYIGTKLPLYTTWQWSEMLRHTTLGLLLFAL